MGTTPPPHHHNSNSVAEHRRLGAVPWPNFDIKKAAPGGNSRERPSEWRASEATMDRLRRLNELDLELFEWAADRTRRQLGLFAASRGEGSPPPLPPLRAQLAGPRIHAKG